MGLSRSDRIMTVFWIAASASACGLTLSGTRSNVPVNSVPNGAEVWMDGVHLGNTPMILEADSSLEHTIELRAEGYTSTRVPLERRLHAGYVFFDIVLGLIPAVIDGATGGWYITAPSHVNVELDPTKSSISEQP